MHALYATLRLARVVTKFVFIGDARNAHEFNADEAVILVANTLPVGFIAHERQSFERVASSEEVKHVAGTFVHASILPRFVSDQFRHAVDSRTLV